MKKYNRILAAVDFSKYTRKIVDHAVTFAQEFNAELLLVNVLNQYDIDLVKLSFNILKRVSENLTIEGITNKLQADREEKMVKLMDEVDHLDVKSRFIIKIGSPVQELLKAVTEEEVDVVIIGAKGKNTFEEAVIGSTALKMFRRCPVTLITVR